MKSPLLLFRDLYLIFGLAVLVAAFVHLIWIQTVSTADGLRTGVYSVLIYTNMSGENYLELGAELASVPGVMWVFYRSIKLISRVQNAPDRKDGS